MMDNSANMKEHRPDPDALLQAVHKTHSLTQHGAIDRGRLKIFFGANAGVGKTYAMLEAAQAQLKAGRDVVAGVVETHSRSETAALLAGLPQLPPRESKYRGIVMQEFDLDAALARNPELILVDELAHTNAPGSRHAKRWQDVAELLNAGIYVYTTVNVQHVESLNDIIAQITGVTVKETIPDAILDQADEIELIDIPAKDLLQRLEEGKVYLPQQAERAMANFFTRPNLTALRELALRRTAQQVDSQLQAERTLAYTLATWPAAERIIVCISSSPHSANLVRTACRLATEMHAEWEAVYVETAASTELPAAAKLRLAETMRLAESLGGMAVTLSAEMVAESVVNYARQRNASKILVGKPAHPPWQDWLRGSLVNAVIRLSGDLDVYVVRAPAPAAELAGQQSERALPRLHSAWQEYVLALGIILTATGAGWLALAHLHPVNIVMLYLLAVVLVALRAGRGPAIFAAFLAVAAFDYFFVPPKMTLAVQNFEYLITFTILLVVGVIIAGLTWRLKQQAQSAIFREQRTAGLYRLSRELAVAQNTLQVALCGERIISELFRCKTAVVLPSAGMQALIFEPRHAGFCTELQNECAVMKWVLENNKPAGLTTGTLPGAEALYLPLSTNRGGMGVLGLCPPSDQAAHLALPEIKRTLDTCATLIAAALEREQLELAEQQAVVQAASERLRSTLLSSISHDLRTPLAGIRGSAETMLELLPAQPGPERELLDGIRTEGERLTLLLENILELTRLTAGNLALRLESQPLEEVVGAALGQLEARLRDRRLSVALPEDLPLVRIDAVLIERVLVNLLDNALKYTPAGTPLELSAESAPGFVVLSLADHGPGLPAYAVEDVFTPFNQPGDKSGSPQAGGHGSGLGLSICKAIVTAHGGAISAAARPGGGSIFRFSLQADTALSQQLGMEANENSEASG
jgi:two-component system, OmpR family, sensor histidine kinase KdpD